MSDETSAAIVAAATSTVHDHRKAYLRSRGAEGHILDISSVGGGTFGTHCLIRYRGRKSGRVMITALSYADIGGEVEICGSKGGADEHPNWYLNLTAEPGIDFQIATQAFRGSWREPEGAEREKVWAFMTDCFPFYTRYQSTTDRVLPLVMMKALEPIPVFTEADITPR